MRKVKEENMTGRLRIGVCSVGEILGGEEHMHTKVFKICSLKD